MRRLALPAALLAASVTVTACVPGLPGSGSKLERALGSIDAPEQGRVLLGYADVEKLRTTFGPPPPMPSYRDAGREGRSIALVGAPRALANATAPSAFLLADKSYLRKATSSVMAYSHVDSNASRTAGGASLFDEMRPAMGETYAVDGTTATRLPTDRLQAASQPAIVRKDGNALVTETTDERPTGPARNRVRELAGCLDSADAAAITVLDQPLAEGVVAFGVAVTFPTADEVSAVYCVEAAEGVDPQGLADGLRGHQGKDYTAGEPSIDKRVIRVELTPAGEPVRAAYGTILGQPERIYPTF
ncbi:hypothetical protein [Granulicoccus sp. GXG6511]|uniref:hypothetical protein n=1 Tax=Granulicoccus sp. GXG6511 TaxID=3381351 RepID=UPI003D7EFEFE